MALHEEYEERFFSDHNYDDDVGHKNKVRRMLEDRLERKRLRDEFRDDFDELGAEFDWDDLDK